MGVVLVFAVVVLLAAILQFVWSKKECRWFSGKILLQWLFTMGFPFVVIVSMYIATFSEMINPFNSDNIIEYTIELVFYHGFAILALFAIPIVVLIAHFVGVGVAKSDRDYY